MGINLSVDGRPFTRRKIYPLSEKKHLFYFGNEKIKLVEILNLRGLFFADRRWLRPLALVAASVARTVN